MSRLFGTDGVRGIANTQLTPELAFKLGRAGAYVLAQNPHDGKAKIVIGKDTRISGDMLEAALIAGITSVGVDVLTVGIIPTPAIAYLTRQLGAQAGVVISASHNPVQDNGIKFFAGDGFKLPDNVEDEIEKYVNNSDEIPRPIGGKVGKVQAIEDAVDQYVEFLKGTVKTEFSGLKIVVDCANGAAYQSAPRVLNELGAEVIVINGVPDGVNINDNCGSTHPEALQKKVVELGADVGIAHDGDADRVIAVDELGNIVDGDFIMYICGTQMKEKGILAKDTIVLTVMSNLGLKLALEEAGIKILETKVGDRYVMEELLKTDSKFGGEQSGHIINLDYNTTGDGVMTALQLVAVVKESGKKLSELAAGMSKLPQILVNVTVKDKNIVMEHEALKKAIEVGEEKMAGEGRILVRPSGTEPLVRVMGEARDEEKLKVIIDEIVQVVKDIEG